MDINTKLENKIVGEAYKQLLKEEPDLINNLVNDLKTCFKSIGVNEKVKNKFEEIVAQAFENQIEVLRDRIEDYIDDNFNFDDVIYEVMEEYINPQVKNIITEKIKSIKFK